jgi:hypothetical protein
MHSNSEDHLTYPEGDAMKAREFSMPARSTVMMLSVVVILASFFAHPAFAAGDPELSPVAKTLEFELMILERSFVPLAEAMPADKYGFAPTAGEFKGVRTFAQQVSHAANAIYASSAAVLGIELPPELVGDENGPATLKTKEDVIAYLKGAIVQAHKAVATLTESNLSDEVKANWGKASRLFMADLMIWHSYDHYGQMVEYVRMNGIVPPSSVPKK